MEMEDFAKYFEGIVIPDEKMKAAYEAHSNSLNEAHSGTTNKTLTEVDGYITELFGVEKGAGEKTKDLIKRGADAYRAKLSEQATSEVSALKSELAEAKKNGAKKEDVEVLQAALLEKQNALAAKDEEYQGKLSAIERRTKISEIKAGITIDKTIKPSLLTPYLEGIEAKAQEIKIITIGGKEYASEDGQLPLVSNDKNVTFEEYVKSLYSEIEAPTTPSGNGKRDDAGQGGDTFALIGSPTNQNEAYELADKYLKKQNLSSAEQRAKLTQLISSKSYLDLPQY